MEYHYARLKYEYNKLDKIRTGVYPEFGGNTEFELFTFFEVCYHLKDWIKESPHYNPLFNVEKYIDSSPALRITADLCNRLKHGSLRNKKNEIIYHKRSQSPLGPLQLQSIMTIGMHGTKPSVRLSEAFIQTERGVVCCYDLAKECMYEWNEYFKLSGCRSVDPQFINTTI